ncbi:MAG: TonB-dependent receptor [Candidatus Marinimicrobia bacterium]|nr:TonB-dependent receptor [Candidatus Neomarinimicrobiota bacterium]
MKWIVPILTLIPCLALAQSDSLRVNNTPYHDRSVNIDIDHIPARDMASRLGAAPGVHILNQFLHLRGGRPYEVDFLLDGVSTRRLARAGTIQSGGLPLSVMTTAGLFDFAPIIPEALDEIAVRPGIYSAHMGDAGAGVIQRTLKTGGERISGSLLYETDAMASSIGEALRPAFGGGHTYAYNTREVTATVGGPLLSRKVRFFGAVQQLQTDDYTPQFWYGDTIAGGNYLTGYYSEFNSIDSVSLMWKPGDISRNGSHIKLQDGTILPAAGNKRASEALVFNGTLTADLEPVVLRLSAAHSASQSDINTFPLWRMFNPRLPRRDIETNLLALDAEVKLGPSTSLHLNANTFGNTTEIYDPYFDHGSFEDLLLWGDSAAVAQAGPKDEQGNSLWADAYAYRYSAAHDFYANVFPFQRPGASSAGYRITNQSGMSLKGDLEHRLGRHKLSAGLSWQSWHYSAYALSSSAITWIHPIIDRLDPDRNHFAAHDALAARVIRRVGVTNIGYDEFGEEITDKDHPDRARRPSILAVYLQDQVKLGDTLMEMGLRVGCYNLDDHRIDMNNPPIDWSEYTLIDSLLFKSHTTTLFEPRLSLRMPLSNHMTAHISFGRFAYIPDLGLSYKSRSYIARVFGGQNYIPDGAGFMLRPVRVTQYEVGINYLLENIVSLDLGFFVKETSQQITQAWASYAENKYWAAPNTSVYVNEDLSTVQGIEFSMLSASPGPLQIGLHYTWASARGLNSTPNGKSGVLNYRSAPVPTIFTPLLYMPKHHGAIYFAMSLNRGKRFAGSNIALVSTFNSGHPYTKFNGFRGYRSSFMGALLDERDPRLRTATEPLGASTTPWVINTDSKATLALNLKAVRLNLYLIITNLFNRRHEINVYSRTGDTRQDGFLSTPRLSDIEVKALGSTFVELYEAINLENRQHWMFNQDYDLLGTPRQIKVGIEVRF